MLKAPVPRFLPHHLRDSGYLAWQCAAGEAHHWSAVLLEKPTVRMIFLVTVLHVHTTATPYSCRGAFFSGQYVRPLQGGLTYGERDLFLRFLLYNFLIRDFNRSEILDQRSMLYFLFYFYIMICSLTLC